MNWIYASLTVVAACGWPLLLPNALAQPYTVIVFLVNAMIVANAWYQCSSPECSFFTGLKVISGSMMSGCANITIIYMPILMAAVYAACVLLSVAGIVQGRERAQLEFLGLVQWFHRKRLNAPLNPLKGLKPIDPSELEVDSEDPESILHAAAMWDQNGDWDRAIELYRYVKQRWPEQHGRYVGNCITEIERKKGIAGGDLSS